MSDEKVYQFNEYVLGYDKGLNDRSCLTISKMQNGNIYVMSSLYDGSADIISNILDNLQQELERYKHYSKTTGIEELMQENEYLKKHQRFHKKFGNDYIFCVEGDKETYKDLLLEKQEELEDYKSRIDKAAEKVNNISFQVNGLKNQPAVLYINLKDTPSGKELLNVLQGGKDDNN